MPEPVGQFLDVSTAARRPPAEMELAAYGIVPLLHSADVVDIGTGDGRLAFGVAASGARRSVGVDPDPVALRAARVRARALRMPNLSFRLGAAQDLPLATERFDVALLSWTL